MVESDHVVRKMDKRCAIIMVLKCERNVVSKISVIKKWFKINVIWMRVAQIINEWNCSRKEVDREWP